MASIYSRRRIRLPKIVYQKFGKMDPNKKNKMLKFCTILSIIIITFQTVIQSISPILDTLCKDKAKSVATIICNEESTKIVKTYQYEDLVTIHRDNDNNITMIQSNITPINLIISDVAENIQNRLNEVKREETSIRLGSFTGIRILSGFGPSIPIKLALVGNVETDLRSEFEEKGINQTIHRIYLQVDCKVSILTPYKQSEEQISNQVLLAENVIVGKIPSSYYNFQGVDQEAALEIVE